MSTSPRFSAAAHGRGLAPVAVERFEDELDAGLGAHEPVRPRPDRRTPEAVLAHLLDILLRDDPRRAGSAGAVEGHEIRPGVLQVKAHAAGIDHLDLAHPLLEDGRGRAAIALEGEFHVLRRHRLAVVKARVLAQDELPHATVLRHGPRLGQAGRVEVRRHRLHEGVVERVEDHERRDLGVRLGGIEPARGERDVDGEGHSAGRLGRGWRHQEAGQSDRAKDVSPARHRASFLRALIAIPPPHRG